MRVHVGGYEPLLAQWIMGGKMYRHLSVFIAATLLGGCGVVAKVNARDDMTASKTAYKSCLLQNPSNVSACEGYRLAFEADLKAYRAASAGIQSGNNNTLNLNTSGN